MGRRRNKGGRGGGGAAAPPAPDRGAGIGPRPPPASASAPRHARRGPRLAPDGAPEVDRERTCPLLLRIFPAATHPVPASLARLAGDGAKPPPGEVQAYTWPDATLRELASLVQEVEPGAAAAGATLDLALVYPGGGGAPTLRRVGRLRASGAGPDDRRTLRGLGFETGDLLSVAVEPPRGGGGVGGRGGGGGDGRRRPRSRSREPRRSRSRSRSPPQKQPRRTRSRSPPKRSRAAPGPAPRARARACDTPPAAKTAPVSPPPPPLPHHVPTACADGCSNAAYPHRVSSAKGAETVTPPAVARAIWNLLIVCLSR